MGKKGIFFTLVAILATSILFIAYSPDDYAAQTQKTDVVKDRITKANNFVRTIEQSYIERALKHSSYTALRAMILYSENQSMFFNNSNFNNNFEAVIKTGNLSNSTKIDDVIGQQIMEGNTLYDLLDKISVASKRILFVDTEFNVTNISIYQNNDTAHWFVGVDLNISYEVNASIANWRKTASITSMVSIIGLEDPYYYISNNRTSNIIKNRIDNFTTDYITENYLWNLTYLKKHIEQRTYKKEENAPSFLMRLKNNTNASGCCGIESIIYHNISRNMSYIDYCFWGTCAGSEPGGNYSLYNVTEITTEYYPFKLELYHLNQYNITENISWVNVTPS